MTGPTTRARRLGVNVDHVATIRQARGTNYPDPVDAAKIAIDAGADQITIHLREDRRHIVDHDVVRMRRTVDVPLNLEMALTDEMMAIALDAGPDMVTLVPEKREERTTEGGLDCVGLRDALSAPVGRLRDAGITVSLFVDPDAAIIDACAALGVPMIELHTGDYADAEGAAQEAERERLARAAAYAHGAGLVVAAGHGLHLGNIGGLAPIDEIVEYNIGHSIVARAIFVGMHEAVREMKAALTLP